MSQTDTFFWTLFSFSVSGYFLPLCLSMGKSGLLNIETWDQFWLRWSRLAPVLICQVRAERRRGKNRLTVNVLGDQRPCILEEEGRRDSSALRLFASKGGLAVSGEVSQSNGAVALISSDPARNLSLVTPSTVRPPWLWHASGALAGSVGAPDMPTAHLYLQLFPLRRGRGW